MLAHYMYSSAFTITHENKHFWVIIIIIIILQSRAFSVVGPLVCNGLPLALRSLPRVFSQKFLQQLKTTLFGRAGVGSASE